MLSCGCREGRPGWCRRVLAVSGPDAVAEQGLHCQQRPVVDEEEMGREGEQLQRKSESEACWEVGLVFPGGRGVARVHVRLFSSFCLIAYHPMPLLGIRFMPCEMSRTHDYCWRFLIPVEMIIFFHDPFCSACSANVTLYWLSRTKFSHFPCN